jgi:hypothetical protein
MMEGWTSTPPSEPGFYWYCHGTRGKLGPPEPVKLGQDGLVTFVGDYRAYVARDLRGSAWGPRLIPPEAPQRN